MSYPRPDAPRIPYDADGTRVLISRPNAPISGPVQAPHQTVSALNRDIGGGLIVHDDEWQFGQSRTDDLWTRPWIALMFPRPMSLRGWALSANAAWGQPPVLGFPRDGIMAPLTVLLQVSTNSTNGEDGTWTTVASKDERDRHLDTSIVNLNLGTVEERPYDMYGVGSIGAWYDSNPFAGYGWGVANSFQFFYDDGPDGWGWDDIDLDDVTSVRLYFPRRPAAVDNWEPSTSFVASTLVNLHLYGYPTSPDDKLVFRNSGDSAREDFFFGDRPANRTLTRAFRVRNLHDQDAKSVVVSIVSDDSHPQSAPGALTLSTDGDVWSPKVELGDIPGGGISNEIQIRLRARPGTVGRRSALVIGKAGRWV